MLGWISWRSPKISRASTATTTSPTRPGRSIPFDAPDYDTAVARTIREQLHNAVDVVTGRNREISTLLIDGTWWMATGGMSGGDLPTDAYEPISLIDAYKVTEKPITVAEISAAHQLTATV